jgi:hypothetical protein
MIAQANTATLKQSQNFDSVSFGIKQEGLAHIFNVLRNQLYSDKVGAVIREYSANAIDAQVESGNQNRPIEVTLPNPLNTHFKVRDYGLGLSESQVRDIYANYGESTKRGTNEQIGQLGLGSKSGFAYGDNFLIRSFQNGTVTSYNAFIDPSQIGQIAKLHFEPTNEQDGIEIEVPVNGRDIELFRKKAQSIYQFFKVKPNVKGNKDFKINSEEVYFQGSDFKFTQQDSYSTVDYGTVALMGNIAYPIDASKVNWGDEEELSSVFKSNLRVDFNIGDLEVAASRESLQYTPHTQKSIIAKARKIKDECLAEVYNKLTNGTSMYEAKCVYNDLFNYYSESPLSFLSGIINKNDLKFKGKDLTSSIWDTFRSNGENYASVKYYQIERSRRYGGTDKVRGSECQKIEANKDYAYVIKDMKSTIINRVAPLCEWDKNHLGRKFKKVYLIEPGPEYDKFVSERQFDVPTVKLSELPKVSLKDLGYVKARSADAAGSALNSKHSATVFKVKYGTGYSAAKSDLFEPAEIDFEAGGIWFEIDRFQPVENLGEYNSTSEYLRALTSSCKLLGLDRDKVVAVKTKDAHKFAKSSKWVRAKQWISQSLQKYVVEKKLDNAIADANEYARAKVADWGDCFKRIPDFSTDLLSQNGEMAVLGQHISSMKPDNELGEVNAKLGRISKWTGIAIKTVEPTHNLCDELSQVKKKYPMYFCLQNEAGYRFNSKVCQMIQDYVNMVDDSVAV